MKDLTPIEEFDTLFVPYHTGAKYWPVFEFVGISIAASYFKIAFKYNF